MVVSDPIADMLTRIRNAIMAKHDYVLVPASRTKLSIAKILKEAEQRVARWVGQLYFVYLPEWQRYARNKDGTFNNRNQVLTIVNEIGIPVIDFHEVLGNHPDPLSFFPFRADGHYTAEGYRLLARKISDYLKKRHAYKRTIE